MKAQAGKTGVLRRASALLFTMVLLSMMSMIFMATHSVHAAGNESIAGQLPDGTRWGAIKPDNWNGTLFLDLDFANVSPGPERPNPFREWALAQGYAMGGITRDPVAYDFPKAVDYLLEVRQFFTEKWSEPKRTLALGNSRGAFVARKSLEIHPEIFKGALISSGGGAGIIATLNSKLDAVWALKTLVDPQSPLRLVNITDIKTEDAALSALLQKANSNPQGRARLALAAAFEQYARWTSRNKPKPAPDDFEAQLDQIAENFAFANPVVVRAGVEKIGGGNVSWNQGIDYADLLKRSGSADMVNALYNKAGLDLQADLSTLAKAPRIAADSAAVARTEKFASYNGKLGGPVVNVDNDDPVDGAPLKLAYVETLRRAGNADQMRLLWVDGVGHGGQTALDRATGLTVLMRKLDSGNWGDTSVTALKDLAAQIAAKSSVDLGKAMFFEARPVAPLRTWDASNWDSYQGK